MYRFLLACLPGLTGETDGDGNQSDSDEEHQDQQLHLQATMAYSATASISAIDSKAAKGSGDYLREVLEPRGIRIITEAFDPRAIAQLQLQLTQPC